VLGHPMEHIRSQTARQQARMYWAQIKGSAMTMEHNQQLNCDASAFLAYASPTVGDLEEYTQQHQNDLTLLP
jgi:hypothetical protein